MNNRRQAKVFSIHIDITGGFMRECSQMHQANAYIFVLCTRGECRINAYMSEITLTENSILTILPNCHFQVLEQSASARLYIVGFGQQLLKNEYVFTSILDYVPHIFRAPTIKLQPQMVDIIKGLMVTLVKMDRCQPLNENVDFVGSLLHSFIILLGKRYDIYEDEAFVNSRSERITKSLIRLISANYTRQRSPAYYAEQLNLTPQHLSSIVSQVTGKTITGIIARFVIFDAKMKLRSSDMSIKEIAFALSFNDISVFGKYFKRYSGMSPRQCRQSSD